MPKKLFKKFELSYKHYDDNQIRDYIERELDNDQFRQHCLETAENLNISSKIVEDAIKDHAFQILKGLQQSMLKYERNKFNVFGFLWLESKRSFSTIFRKIKF